MCSTRPLLASHTCTSLPEPEASRLPSGDQVTDGRLYDVHYTSKQKSASTDFLTQFDGGLVNVAAFFSSDANYRHIIALDAKGDLYDYVRTAQSEVGKTQVASFSHIVDMAAYYSAYDNYRQIIVATKDGNLHEVYYPRL